MGTISKRSNQWYGWVPDIPDHRDFQYAAPPPAKGLPPSVDLRSKMPPVYDQGELGSCTANAIGAAVEFARKKEGEPRFQPSRLFIYYNERVIEGTVGEDGGAQIRDGMKVVAKLGVTPENKKATPGNWPYDPKRFKDKPPAAAFKTAEKNQVLIYRRVPQSLSQLKGCLASGFPIIFGFSVYDAFESAAVARTGVLNLPAHSEKMVGGHAVLAVGYDEASQRFLVRNSWGVDWGQKGYFTMPYAYVANNDLADDLWTIRLTE
jgi:C1A family cysteine protease